MKNTIVITAFNRPRLFEDCLQSCLAQNQIHDYNLVVIRQKGNDELAQLIDRYSNFFSTVVETDPSGSSSASMITNNRILGYYIGFEFWKSKFVVALEDDVVISKDALSFVEYIFTHYNSDSKFRGVNFGSQLEYLESRESKYSQLRYGMHGPASMITNKTWKSIKPNNIMKNHTIDFDAQIEFALKSGYMITPNVSRYKDQGVLGTHSDGNSNLDYFTNLENSFVTGNTNHLSYFLYNEEPRWRNDCIIYKPKDNAKYYFKMVLYRYVRRYSVLFNYIFKLRKTFS